MPTHLKCCPTLQDFLSIYFWGECVQTAAYLINRTPTPLLHSKSPYEILFNKALNYPHLGTFGFFCFAHNSTDDKFTSRSNLCIFVGYQNGKKGWKI